MKAFLSPQTNALFEQELSSMNVPRPFSRFAPETYDAVWSIALALQGAERQWRNESANSHWRIKKLDVFDYTRQDLAKDFLRQFSHLKFQGVSVSNFSPFSGKETFCFFVCLFMYPFLLLLLLLCVV